MLTKLNRLLEWAFSPKPPIATLNHDDTIHIHYQHAGGGTHCDYADLPAALNQIEEMVNNAHEQLKREIADLRRGEYGLE